MFDGLRKELGTAMPVPLSDEALAGPLCAEFELVCADAGYAQDEAVLRREIRECLERAMETLTPLERAILHHHYYKGQPVQLLVGSTSLSKSWLSRVHSRALSKMRDCLLARAKGQEAYL
jgi:DNA-directed RNA polymerase specialized sigma24 family protein